MSSTWIRAEIAARSAWRRIVDAGGTPGTSLCLAALAVAFQLGAVAVAAMQSPARAVMLRGSFAFGALAVALLADALLSVRRFWPVAWTAVVRREAGSVRKLAGAILCAAYALLGVGAVASWYSHDITEVRLAVGERYGDPGQVVGFEGLRGTAPNLPRAELVAEAVSFVDRADGTRTASSATVLSADGGTVEIRRWRPLWLGASALALPGAAGLAAGFEVREARGGLLEAGHAKLDVLPPGKRDVLTFERIPHRAVLARERDAAGRVRWAVALYRGKLPVAAARLSEGEAVPFEGLQLVMKDEIPTVTLQVHRDAGLPFALAACALATVAVLAWTARGRGGGGSPSKGDADVAA